MKYSVIYADPPWRFKNWSMDAAAVKGEKWGRANGRSEYDTMNTADIARLPVAEIAEKDCVLFLWATYPKLPDALQVMAGWGFQFKTVAHTWVKTYPKNGEFICGMGYWTRGNAEILLLGTRGHPKRVSKFVRNLIVAPRGRHSAKPPEVRDRIVELVGDLPRIELFARPPVPAGWDALGDEVDGKDIRDALKEIVNAAHPSHC